MYAALINTHKRGVALGLFALSPELSPEDCCIQAATTLLGHGTAPPAEFELQPDKSLAKRYQGDVCVFSVCAGLTAENLSHLYIDSLAQLGILDQQISMVGVLVGPGSFTGLRLGTAFANGLNFGRERQLWAIESQSVRESPPQELVMDSQFWGEDSTDEHDPYAVTLAFGDLYLSLQQWSQGRARLVAHLEPQYGRDPTPVIKLRQQKERSSQ